MQDEIIKILKDNEIPMTELDIQDKLSDKLSLEDLCELLRIMEKKGEIYVTKKGKYTLFQYTHLKVGKLSVSKKGFGFVILNNEPDIHISKENMNGALHNDLVAAEYINEEEGRIVKIIDRSFDTIIGEYITSDEMGKIIVDDPRLKIEIYIDEEHRNNAMPGHKVIVKPYAQVSNIKYYGEVIKILGHKDDIGIDILSKVYEWDIEPNFTDETIEEVNNISPSVSDSEMVGRKDLRGVQTVTIDGDDAKDFDDAISAEKLSNGNIKTIVSIADVSHYVKKENALGRDAEERGTSVYLVDRVIPMLPHQLSNGICSLNPHVDRLALSCEMEIDEHGKIVNFDVYESVINSALRMTYNKANEFLEKNIIPKGYENFTELLTNAYQVSKWLSKMKYERGELRFDIPEIKIIVDEECKPVEISKRDSGIGQRLIEDLMVAANETVAEYITNICYPMMYRIHEIPMEKKIREYITLLKVLGHNVKINGKIKDITPKEMQKILNGLQGSTESSILSELGLRAMQKAIYSTQNLGHFGLASKCYCHFTSPIRRYPDLTVHRVLKTILHGTELSVTDLKELESELSKEAIHASLKERNSVECERDVEDMKIAEYMQNHIGEEYTGQISGVIPSGVFVRLPNMIEGRVAIGSMKGDYYIVDELSQSIFGKKSGIKYKLGDNVNVKVTAASKIEGTVDFEIIKKDVSINENKKES